MTIKRAFGGFLAATMLAGALLATPATEAHAAAVIITAGYAPPAIPVYDQPECPGDGYLWTPGYWAWSDQGGYYWVDGAWVEPPYVEALWTPGWWGWGYGGYFWHPGYWGRSIGYYGGINYGFGYFGVGFYGGYWNGGRFWYNRAYGHFGAGFRGSVYERAYAGFNGRPGGASFNAHPPAQFAGQAHGEQFNHASSINGSESFRGGAAQGNYANRGTVSAGGQGYSRSSQPAQSYSRPSAPSGGSHYSAPAGGGGHYSAPSGGGHASGGGGHSGGGHR